MKKTLLLLLLPCALWSQPDTARVLELMEAGKTHLQTAPDSAARLIGEALVLAEELDYARGQARCLINLSFAYNNLGRYRDAIQALEQAIPVCEKQGMKRELVAAYNNLGNAWDYLGNRWMAIDAFSKALQSMDGVELPPHFPLAVRGNIARLYNNLRLFDKGYAYASENYEEALKLGDSVQIAYGLQDLVHPLLSMGREAEALERCRQLLPLTEAFELPTLQVFALNNLAYLDTVGAVENRLRALAIARQTNDAFGIVSSLQGLAKHHLNRGEIRQARAYVEEFCSLAETEERATCQLFLSDLALAAGDFSAYRSHRSLYEDISDTLAGNALIHAVQELETRYETDKKDQQIAIQQLRLQRKNGLVAGMAGLAGLILLISLLALRNLQQRRRIQEQEIRQLKQEQQLSVADAVLRSQETERSRFARDLHDGLGGMLSGVKQTLNGMKGNQILSETAASALNQVLSDLDRSIAELRHIARNMMPEALVRFGLRDALQDYCDHLGLNAALSIRFQFVGDYRRLDQQTEVILFRIAQELLNNTLKHAEARQVLVQLLQDDERTSLTVEDDGKGFDPESLRQAPGVGWLNIQSRVEYLQGSLDLRSKPEEGTSVTVEVRG